MTMYQLIAHKTEKDLIEEWEKFKTVGRRYEGFIEIVKNVVFPKDPKGYIQDSLFQFC